MMREARYQHSVSGPMFPYKELTEMIEAAESDADRQRQMGDEPTIAVSVEQRRGGESMSTSIALLVRSSGS